VRSLEGRSTSFVTVARQRRFDIPENIFLKAFCTRVHGLLVLVRKSDVINEDTGSGWGVTLRGCEGALRRLLTSTVLREVPDGVPTVFDGNAARAARHAAYHAAVVWAAALSDLEDDDPAKTARLVAMGALLPLSPDTRFELAVTMRLAEELGRALEAVAPGRWRAERGIVISDRRDLFTFVRDDGRIVRVFYNQAVLPSGSALAEAFHYFGKKGPFRPDIVISFEDEGERERRNAVVIECKNSANRAYQYEGFTEARIYAWEFADHLRGPLKSILVTSSPLQGGSLPDRTVVAADWTTWPPPNVIAQLVAYAGEPLEGSTTRRRAAGPVE
jgi:hypothetical protein